MPDGDSAPLLRRTFATSEPDAHQLQPDRVVPNNKPDAAAPLPRRPSRLTRAQLAQRIARGESLVLHGRRIYKLDRWKKLHPGGELPILHFVGRDASCEIEAYHSPETLKRMRAFQIAILVQDDELAAGASVLDGIDADTPLRTPYKPLVPPVQLGYRDGKLDHPQAQIDACITDLLSPAQRPTHMPIPVEMLEPPHPPSDIDPLREARISQAWKQMHADVKAAGLYELRPAGYLRELARYVALGYLARLFFRLADGENRTYLLLSSFFLGLFWHQLTFTAHDAGHSGITHHHFTDRLIGTLIADLIGGLSIGWWCDNHDVHHLVTNHPEHDPDIQHMPFFAISKRFVDPDQAEAGASNAAAGRADPAVAHDAPSPLPTSAAQPTRALWSSYYRRLLAFDAPARLFLRHQHRLYYVVMSLGRFNLYANSYAYLATKARRREAYFWMELASLATFWWWFGYETLWKGCPDWPTRIGYLLVSHVVTSPLHVQIVLSHFAQSSDDKGLYESFASRQVRTTMDVRCPPWLDFLHGGLHMQVSHHLFPRVPRHNLRALRDGHVRPFAREFGLEYAEYTFGEGNGRVRSRLAEVARQVGLLVDVAHAQARGELQH